MLKVVTEGEQTMKKLSVVGLLIALAVAPLANAFAQSSAPQLPPGFGREGLAPDEITPDLTWLEFFLLAPTVTTNTLSLSFILAVNNFTDAEQQITIRTRTLSGSNFERQDIYGPRETKFWSAAQVSCPTTGGGDVCRLTLISTQPGPTCFVLFDSLLIILDQTRGGEIVAILPPSFPQCQ
jgi:hypothetical protein